MNGARPLSIDLDSETFDVLDMLAGRFAMSPAEMFRRMAVTLATSAIQMRLDVQRTENVDKR